MESMSNRKRVRDESDVLEFDLPEVKKLRDDLLGIFDESDDCSASQDLDSFMKSFEDEISAKSSPAASVVDLTSESGDSQLELGYLFGASDDELGLPPSVASPTQLEKSGETTDLLQVVTESNELSNGLWGLGDEITGFDSFEYGYDFAGVDNTAGEYVAFEDGLFDYTDLGFGSNDVAWRSETLPAK